MDISYLKVAASDVYQPTNFREKEGKKKKKMKEKRKKKTNIPRPFVRIIFSWNLNKYCLTS